MNLLKELFSLKGRMRRRDYIAVYLPFLGIILAIGFAERQTGTGSFSMLTLLLIAALVPPSVRRLHDIGYSGWLVIAAILIPCVPLLLLLAPGEPGSNAYGPNPKTPTA
jgi:uncharacterized membrane protein YhaH (DUF805 family)